MAKDGAQAIDLFRKNKDIIKLVFLDITMPGMSGEEASLEILAIRPAAKVVLTSGYKQDHLDSDLTQKGLADFIHKPYELRVLSEKLREVLEPSAQS